MSLTITSHDDLRIMAGIQSRTTILNDATALVKDWTKPNDVTGTVIHWLAVSKSITDGVLVRAIDGSAGLHGKASGVIEFAMLSPQMAMHILNDVLAGQYVNDVTISVFHPIFGQSVYTCKMAFPLNMVSSGQQQNASIYSNVEITWDRGTILGNSWDDSWDASFG